MQMSDNNEANNTADCNTRVFEDEYKIKYMELLCPEDSSVMMATELISITPKGEQKGAENSAL